MASGARLVAGPRAALTTRSPSSREAPRIKADVAEIHTNLGATLRIQPDFVAAHFSRGIALMQSGRRDEAIAEWEATLALSPRYPPAKRMQALAH